jgi:hypothetical protein
MRSKRMGLRVEVECDEMPYQPGEDGITMECTCPRCGISHRMKLLWAGRGRPKKFCQPWRRSSCRAYRPTSAGAWAEPQMRANP